MDLNKKIENIKDYFRLCNIAEGIMYVLVEFPEGWIIPTKEILKELYKVETVADNKSRGFYFYIQLNEDTDNVFNAIDYTIALNKNIQEKNNLFEEALLDLKEMFMNEDDIVVLKSLKMTFTKKGRKQKKKLKEETLVATPVETQEEPQVQDTGILAEVENIIEEENVSE